MRLEIDSSGEVKIVRIKETGLQNLVEIFREEKAALESF